MCLPLQKHPYVCHFSIGAIGNATEHLLKCVKIIFFYQNTCNLVNVEKKNCCYFAETFMQNVYSVISYGTTNMKVFAIMSMGKLQLV